MTAERALHPVSDATPDLAAALAILRAHHGTIGDDEHLDEAIHHLSHAVAIRKMDTLASGPVLATGNLQSDWITPSGPIDNDPWP